MSTKKIAFYLHAITDGGQCKVLLDLASGLSESGYDVTFIHDIVTSKIFLGNISKKLNFHHLKLEQRQSGFIPPNFKSIYPLSRVLKQLYPDVVISGGSVNNCMTILAKQASGIDSKTILTEHADLSSVLMSTSKLKGNIIIPLMKFCYNKADYLAAVSQGVADDLSKNLNLHTKKINTIYNPVISKKFHLLKQEPVYHPWINNSNIPLITSVGRLSYQKDYFNLIDAFNELLKFKDANLLILGEGEDRTELQRRIDELNISDKVQMPGRTANPYAYIFNSDLFVLSSRWEGLPTVLIEALGCDTPIVSTDCPHGPREILENGKWGKLVPIEDSELLYKAMLSTLNESQKQPTLLRAEDFSFNKSISNYISVIENLINKDPN